MKRLILILTALLLTGCVRMAPRRAMVLPSPTPEMLIVRPTRVIPTPIVPEIAITLTAIVRPSEMIVIDGVSRGAYGRTVVTNANTDARLEYIGYFVPVGQYKVTNNRANMDQFNVYTSATYWDNGVEYPSDGNAYLFQPGETKTIYVPSGYYVKVSPRSDFTMVR